MAKYVRYAFAFVCFAVSVGFLALWWRNVALCDVVQAATMYAGSMTIKAEVFAGVVVTSSSPKWPTDYGSIVDSFRLGEDGRSDFQQNIVGQQGQFGAFANGVYFPLWYPALVFALAGVGFIRFRHQFSIRSALIAFAVVAALLGIVVAL